MLRAQGLGTLHPVITDVPVFADAQGQRVADAAMWREFREVELVDRHDQLHAAALDSLAVLARPSVEYFAAFTEQDAQRAVLVAALGTEAVVVVRAGDAVTVSSFANRSLPEALVSHLPRVRPARVKAVNVRLAEVDAVGEDSHAVLLNAMPGVERDVALVEMLRGQAATGMGELYAAARDRWGHRAVLADPIMYRDSRAGRILVRYAGGYLSIAPATPALLAQRLHDAHHSLVN
jgi:hypothetical protein